MAGKRRMTESVTEKVVRLETQMVDNKSQLNRVETKVDSLINKMDNLTLLQTEVTTIRLELNALKASRALTGWLYPTLAAGGGAIIAILIKIALTKQ